MPAQEAITISRFHSIRTRLILAFVLIVLLPMSIISAVLAISTSEGAHMQLAEQLDTVASLKESALNTLAATLKAELGNALIGENTQQYVSELVEKSRDSQEFWTAHNALKGRFQQLITQLQRFDAIFMMDRHGRVVLSTDPEQEGRSYADQAFFQRGLGGSVLYPSSLGQTVMLAARPVVGESGRAAGVLAGRTRLDIFNEIARVPTGLGKTGKTFLVSRDHTLLTPLPDVPHGAQVQSEEIEEVLKTHNKGFGVYTNFRGVSVIGAYRWLPELGVAMMVEQEHSESSGATSALLAINAGVALAAIIIAAFASLGVARSIAVPLADLSETASLIANGRLELVADVKRKDEIGALAQTFNFMTDKLKQTMDGLRRSEEKYHTLVDNVKTGVYRNNVEGRFIQINPAIAEIFGYDSVEEFMGITVADLYQNPEDRNNFTKEVQEKGFVKNYELALKKKDGAPIWCSITATAQRDEQGEIKWFDGVVEDITQRKRAEEERERLIRELTDAVARVKALSGMLPICASCKRIRNDKGYWEQVEVFVSEHSEAVFSHGVCPECMTKLYPDYVKEKK